MSFDDTEDQFGNFYDWINFCENDNSELKPEDFYTLLMEERSPQRLQAILQYFPCNEDLYIRLSSYLDIESPKWANEIITEQDALRLAERDLESKLKVYQEQYPGIIETRIEDFQSNLIANLIEYKTRKQNSNIHVNFIQGVNDYVIMNDKLGNRLSFALSEMYYGLTTSFEMVWYLIEPLINTKHDFSNYFKLAYFGYDYFIEANNLILLRPDKT